MRDDSGDAVPTVDLGFSHVAIFVEDLDRSLDFNRRFGGFKVSAQRESNGSKVAHINDGRRPLSLVRVQPRTFALRKRIARMLKRWLPSHSHFGVGCESRDEVDRLCGLAREEGCLRQEPKDGGSVVGYYGLIRDPDGNDLEVAYGQQMFHRLGGGR